MIRQQPLLFLKPIKGTGILVLLMASMANAETVLQVKKIGDSVVDPAALTINGAYGVAVNGKSFQQDVVVSHKGWQYVAYYDATRYVCVARRKLTSDKWETLRLTDYPFTSDDAHNTISMGICPKDGTIHLAFDHHGSSLHYRVSKLELATDPGLHGWNSDSFGPVKSALQEKALRRVTYPRFWQAPGGALQFGYRYGGSGNGARRIADYDPASGKWKSNRRIDSGRGTFVDVRGAASKSRCSYPNGYTYGPTGRLHTTWVWRENSKSPNHDLMYAYSDDQGHSWLNNAGQLLDESPQVNTEGITVAKLSILLGLMNTTCQAVDSADRIHTVLSFCTEESLQAEGLQPGEMRWGAPNARRYYHYWRQTDGTWQHTELPGIAGGRPKLFADSDNNLVLICNTTRQLPVRPASESTDSDSFDLAIMVATANSQWTDWQLAHTEPGPFVNEMLGDSVRWTQQRVLSVLAQELPATTRQPTPLRILDFSFN